MLVCSFPFFDVTQVKKAASDWNTIKTKGKNQENRRKYAGASDLWQDQSENLLSQELKDVSWAAKALSGRTTKVRRGHEQASGSKERYPGPRGR